MSPFSYPEMEPAVAGHAYDFAEEQVPQRGLPDEKHGLLAALTSALAPQLDKLKGLALGAALGIVRDLITQSAPPELGGQVASVVNDFTTRLGGEVIHEPILESLRGTRSSGHYRDHSDRG